MITSAVHVVLQFESLALLTPTQAAELTLSSGALNNTNQISAVFNRLQEGNAFENVEEFLTTLSAAPEASQSLKAADRFGVDSMGNSHEYDTFLWCHSQSWCCISAGS